MCGISLVINRDDKSVLENRIRPMNDIIHHRGPDAEGFFYGENFAFGHRRLSILDLTAASNQPFHWKHLSLTYNGEVYNYIELRNELKSLGHNFKTNSDTEVVIASYYEWGIKAFSKFNGMWALAIYDKTNNEIILCRDHFGIKPLYYTKTSSYFLAGSEIKQFTTFDEFKPILNKNTAVNFLVNGYLNYSENTFFEGVYELRAGHYLKYNLTNHDTNKVKWYDLKESIVPAEISENNAVIRFRKLFKESLKIRMRSDVLVGSCLSGGIDSSAIVSMVKANNLSNDNFSTVTSCFEDKRFDEQKFSDLVSKSTGFKSLKVFPNLDDLLNENHFDEIIFHQDQPVYSGSCYSEYNVFKKARQNGLTVMLDGQGSDEYLYGYPEFYKLKIKELLGVFKLRTAFSLITKKAGHKNHSTIKEIISIFKSVLVYPSVSFLKQLIGKNNYSWLNEDWQKIVRKESVFGAKNLRELSIEEVKYSSIPYQLHSEDRNSMMFSVESRLPFLCPRLVEFSIGLDDSMKMKDAYTKYVLRKAVPEMPKAIRERKDKMGFVSPDAYWMNENRIKVRKELDDFIKSYGIVNEKLLQQFDNFCEGNQPYNPVFFRAISMSRFCRIFKLSVVK